VENDGPPSFGGAANLGYAPRFQALCVPSSWFRQNGVISSHPPVLRRGITQAVETVEKVPFQKLIFGKWDKNIEKRLVFCVPNNILAIFEPVVGDFCEDFSSKEFFDSLVGRFNNTDR
jgi:hypothetical protein